MKLPHFVQALRGDIGRVRYLRRELGWRQALEFVKSERSNQGRIRTKLPGTEQAVSLRQETSDVKVFEKIWLDHEYASPYPVEARFIVDAGANIGMSALYFARAYPEAEVVALEPEANNYALLEENCVGVPRIHPRRAALWNQAAALRIADPDADSWAFHLQEVEGGDGTGVGPGTVAAVTIPQLLVEYGRATIDILKIDIEGGEQQLFTPESVEWLSRVRLLIIELHDRFRVGCSRSVYSRLVTFSFTQEVRGENIFILLEPGAPRPTVGTD